MAAEAITLGVPALYAGRDFPGYTEELGREGLLEIVRPDARDSLVARCRALLEDGESFSEKHAAWIVSCPDWSDEVVAEADRMACAPW